MRAAIVVNPVAGKGRGQKSIPLIQRAINNVAPSAQFFLTRYAGEIKPLINRLIDEIDVLFICGGDGTLHELVNALPPRSTLSTVVVPIGSGNDFTRALNTNINKSLEQLALSNLGKKIRCDLGHAIITAETGEIIDTNFHSSLGAGFDAHVSNISNRKTFLRGLPLYLSSVFLGLFSFQSVEAEIDGETSKKLLVSFGNTATAGGGFKLTPKASITDGMLDLMTADELSPAKILTVLPRAITGGHLTHSAVKYKTVTSAEIFFKSPVIIHADGDILTKKGMSLRVEVIPEAFTVYTY